MAINAQQLEGKAIKGSGPSIYLVTGGSKYGFSGMTAWNNYGLSTPSNLNNWTTVTDADLQSIPDGQGSINPQGILVNRSGQPLGNGKTMNVVMNRNQFGGIQRVAGGSNTILGGMSPRPMNFNPNPTQNGGNGKGYSYADVQRLGAQIARQTISWNAQQASRKRTLAHVFTDLKMVDDVLENQTSTLTNGLFSGNTATLSTMFTSSLQTTSSKQYYYETWNKEPDTNVDSEPQFSVAYGHRLGSGSSSVGTYNDSPTRAVYSQYRLLLLTPEDNVFTFKDGTSSDSVYMLNFNRARVKEKLDPGNWQMAIAQLSGSTVANNLHTGSSVKIAANPAVFSLIDDSGDIANSTALGGAAGAIYNIVSGSLTDGIYNPSAPHYYGLVYPEMGVIVLNDAVLNQSCSFNTVSGSNTAGDNAWKLFTSISGAMSINSLANVIQARNVETISSTHYFVRVKNGEYNYSNNPTYVTGSEGEIANKTFKLENPITYITTVGLYNERQELLAVAKLSQPIQKSFAVETLIKVKLDY